MLIGYARVSTEDQNLDLQCDALTAAGCERIFEDKASGVRDDRPGLAGALSHLRRGDCLVIWRLDRLGRRMIALLSFVEELRQRGCSAVKAIYGPRVTAFSRRTTVSSFAACQNRGARCRCRSHSRRRRGNRRRAPAENSKCQTSAAFADWSLRFAFGGE